MDFRANANLLDASLAAGGVSRFGYVHVLTRGPVRSALIAAKARFVTHLHAQPIDSLVIRPGGYFSDLAEVFHMAARGGRVWLVGDGQVRLNPIDGADLAKVIVEAVQTGARDIEVGGPEVLTLDQIAHTAFAALDRPARIGHLPPRAVAQTGLAVLKPLTPPQRIWGGPVEFFLAASAQDMVAPQHGTRRLADFYAELAQQNRDQP